MRPSSWNRSSHRKGSSGKVAKARARAARACGVSAAIEPHGVRDPGGRVAAVDLAGSCQGGVGAGRVFPFGQGSAAVQPAGDVAVRGFLRRA